jgi:GNAT superfamily N-acetyltransferase
MSRSEAYKALITVEKAHLVDIPQLCELLELLFLQEIEFQPDAARQEIALHEIINNEHIGSILVLRDKSQVFGMVSVLYTVSTALGGRVGIVEDLIVRPGYRNQGWGSLLIREAIKFAMAAGCLRLTVLTDGENLPAMRFYERHGFAASSMKPFRLFPTDAV